MVTSRPLGVTCGSPGALAAGVRVRSWRRRGVAALLMQHVLAWARHERLDRLVLHASAEGRRLYEGLGFVATNEMRFAGDLRGGGAKVGAESAVGSAPSQPRPAYVVVQIAIEDPVAYEQYKALAPPSIAAYGGRYVVRGGASEVLEGSWQPSRLVLLEFPSVASARAWWDSPEYAPAKALRQRCARTEMLVIEGAPGPGTG
jgi:uncharacterized protein (DUF1330 family)